MKMNKEPLDRRLSLGVIKSNHLLGQIMGGYFLFINVISTMTIVRYKIINSIVSPSFE